MIELLLERRQSINQSTNQPISQSLNQSVRQSVCLFIRLSVCLSECLSSCSICGRIWQTGVQIKAPYEVRVVVVGCESVGHSTVGQLSKHFRCQCKQMNWKDWLNAGHRRIDHRQKDSVDRCVFRLGGRCVFK